MTLTSARGPFGPQPAGRFSAPMPAGVIYAEPHPRRVQGRRDGQTVIDTERALLVHEAGRPPAYAFPAEAVGDVRVEAFALAPGYVTVAWGALDEWIEEGRPLVHYPPNPYHRVDCHPTSRRLRVTVGDTALVDTDDTTIVFETALDPVLYVDPSQVRTELLSPSDTTSYCNYKGTATYWSATVDDVTLADVAWSYEDPRTESADIAGFLSFDAKRIAVVADLPVGARPGSW